MLGFSFDRLPMYTFDDLLQLGNLTNSEKQAAEKLGFEMHKSSYQYTDQPLPDLDMTSIQKSKIMITERNKLTAQQSNNVQMDYTQRKKYVIKINKLIETQPRNTPKLISDKLPMYAFNELLQLENLTNEEKKEAAKLAFGMHITNSYKYNQPLPDLDVSSIQKPKIVMKRTPYIKKKKSQPIVQKTVKKEAKPNKYYFDKVFMYDFDQLMELQKLTKHEKKKALELEFSEFKELCPINAIENLPELDYTPIKKVKPQMKKRVAFKKNTPEDWVLVSMN
jgi:hypothetical protein